MLTLSKIASKMHQREGFLPNNIEHTNDGHKCFVYMSRKKEEGSLWNKRIVPEYMCLVYPYIEEFEFVWVVPKGESVIRSFKSKDFMNDKIFDEIRLEFEKQISILHQFYK